MFAHEMDDGSVNTDVNAADVSDRNEQQRREDDDYDETGGGGGGGVGGESVPSESGVSYDDAAADHEESTFDNGSSGGDDDHDGGGRDEEDGDDDDDDDEMTSANGNVEVVFETSDENIVVVETVECKPDFEDCRSAGGNHHDNDDDDDETTPPSHGYEGGVAAADDKINVSMMSCESDDSFRALVHGECMDDEEMVVVGGGGGAGQSPGIHRLNLKIVKVSTFCIFSVAFLVSRGSGKARGPVRLGPLFGPCPLLRSVLGQCTVSVCCVRAR